MTRVEIKTYSRKELVNLYQISAQTFARWLNRANLNDQLKHKQLFTPAEVEKIFGALGEP